MGADLYAMTDAFCFASLIATDLSHAFRKKEPVRMLTYSKQIFDVITGGKWTIEKRLAINISTTREAYCQFYIEKLV